MASQKLFKFPLQALNKNISENQTLNDGDMSFLHLPIITVITYLDAH